MSNRELDAIQAELAAGMAKLEQEENPTTAREDFALYYQQKAEEAQKAIMNRAESMTAWAREAQQAFNRVSQWDLSAKRKTTAKARELEGKYDAASAEIAEIRNKMKFSGIGDLLKDFNEEIDAHLATMKRHFRFEENPVKDRF